MLSVDAENSQKIREHAHEWKNQLVTTATERIVVHRSEIEKTRKTETLTAGADKQATDKSIKHEKNERLLRYWIMTRDHLNELKPDNSLVHAITLFTIASSIQGLEQTDEISTQQARLFALNNDFDRVYRRLEKIRSDIRHVEKELQASEHKMMRRFKRCLDYNTTFEAFKEDEQ